MQTITSVEPQKKNTRRFNVFLNGEFAFGADEDTVVNFRLVKGKQISPQELQKILFETEIGKWMDRMYGLFSIRQRTEKEVRDYFFRKNMERKLKDKEQVSNMIIDLIIERLIQKNLINDKQFALAWTEARRKSHKKGINLIKAELYKKGINREIIEEVLTDSTQSEGSEEELAWLALQKKSRIWSSLAAMELKKKSLEFLVRRGFSYDVAKTTVEKFLNKDYNNS